MIDYSGSHLDSTSSAERTTYSISGYDFRPCPFFFLRKFHLLDCFEISGTGIHHAKIIVSRDQGESGPGDHFGTACPRYIYQCMYLSYLRGTEDYQHTMHVCTVVSITARQPAHRNPIPPPPSPSFQGLSLPCDPLCTMFCNPCHISCSNRSCTIIASRLKCAFNLFASLKLASWRPMQVTYSRPTYADWAFFESFLS